MTSLAGYATILAAAALLTPAIAQEKSHPTPAQAMRTYFTYVNGKLLDMAKDFPEDKYEYRPTKEMRSFRELIVHVASGNVFAAKAGRGEKVKWDELDAKNYPTKADAVALLEKSTNDATAALKAQPDDAFAKTLYPWNAVIQHSSEHYGLLVAYFRLNGIVPPETRKEQQK